MNTLVLSVAWRSRNLMVGGLLLLPLACGEKSAAGTGATGGGAGTTSTMGGSGGSSGVAGTSGSPTGGTGTSGAAGSGGGAGQATGGGSGTGGGTAGSSGSAGAGTSCTMGAWPAADPAMTGPYATTTENEVGPAAGVGADGGAAPMFTLFRPTDLGQPGLCHPVITWGNGTGSSPSLYGVLLRHLASHGFVVIASNSPQVAQGDPPPMVVGVRWVIEQNGDPASPMYGRIDTAHVGATGHSQGGFATTAAAGDESITTIAPLCGAQNQRNLHGPALLLCGGMDTMVPCSTVMNAYNGIMNQPIMLANYLAADHVNWVTFRGTTVSPMEVAVTAWMRVHLMGDTALRGRFYGPACTLCTDAAWQISSKMMDQ